MKYIPAKLHVPKKPTIKNGKKVWDYYIHWTCENKNGEMIRHKDRSGINYIKDLKERKRKGLELAAAATLELKIGNNPAAKIVGSNLEYERNKNNFYWWYEERLKYIESAYGYHVRRNNKAILNKMQKFRSELLVKDFNYKFILDFEAYLISIGNSTNTISDNLHRISAVVKDILKNRVMLYHENPFLNYKFKSERIEKSRASYEDLKKLEFAELINKNEDQSRDMYILSFYVGGIRFADTCRLENAWFTETHLDYIMHKANNKRSIKLTESAIRIVNKYKSEGKYLFDTKVDWSKEEYSIDIRNSFYRKKLKSACIKAGINELTFHTSRNSLADHAKSMEIDIHTIKDLLGHSKVATTEKYMKAFYREETESAINKMFGE